jgi:hypothetical protein
MRLNGRPDTRQTIVTTLDIAYYRLTVKGFKNYNVKVLSSFPYNTRTNKRLSPLVKFCLRITVDKWQ